MEGTTPTVQAIRETGGQRQRQKKDRHSSRARTVGFHMGHRDKGGNNCQAENSRLTLEHRASSSRGKHEGESSYGLCDRLNRTRDNSQRQLPTDQDYAVSTREYQIDQSSLKTAPTAARSVLDERPHQQQQTHRVRRLTRSLHIRPYRVSPSVAQSRRPKFQPKNFGTKRYLHVFLGVWQFPKTHVSY